LKTTKSFQNQTKTKGGNNWRTREIPGWTSFTWGIE